MKYIIAPLALAASILSFPAFAQEEESGRYTGPIIDMHLHAKTDIFAERQLCFPEPCEGARTIAQNIAEVRAMTLEAMDRHRIVLGVVSGMVSDVLPWAKGEEHRFLVGILAPSRVPFEELKALFASGQVQVMGEMKEQYFGIPIDDPSLDPLFALAHDLDVPVHVHVAGLGGTADFPAHLGNPLRLVPVLRKYPGLRIYLENAGWPFLEEATSLMYQYPTVYADVSTILHLTPRPTALRYVKGLIDNGLGKRIMFGSDQMIWPEVIDVAIDAIQTAEFLTPEMKADIFYNNAARFLRLSDEEIAAHHKK